MVLRRVRVFVASPSDVMAERTALAGLVDEFNRDICAERGLVLELVRWETHAVPRLGRPQAIVNRDVGDFDVMIGIMWKHFGTPTGEAASGTEEEFQVAYDSWRSSGRPRIMFYFSEAPYSLATPVQVEQLAKVVLFRDRLQNLGLYWTYKGAGEFVDTVRPHLYRTITDITSALESSPDIPNAPKASHDIQARFGLAMQAWQESLAVASEGELFEFARHVKQLAVTGEHLPLLITSVLRAAPWRLTELRFGFSDDAIHEYLLAFLQRGEETAPGFERAIRALGGWYGLSQPRGSNGHTALLLHIAGGVFSIEARVAALDSLWSLLEQSDYAAALDVIRRILAFEKHFQLRRASVNLLGRVHNVDAQSLLLGCAKEPMAAVRKTAVSSLMFGSRAGPVDPDLLYEWLVTDRSTHVQRQILKYAAIFLAHDRVAEFYRRAEQDTRLKGEFRGLAGDIGGHLINR